MEAEMLKQIMKLNERVGKLEKKVKDLEARPASYNINRVPLHVRTLD
jgi:hypothetical protein